MFSLVAASSDALDMSDSSGRASLRSEAGNLGRPLRRVYALSPFIGRASMKALRVHGRILGWGAGSAGDASCPVPPVAPVVVPKALPYTIVDTGSSRSVTSSPAAPALPQGSSEVEPMVLVGRGVAIG